MRRRVTRIALSTASALAGVGLVAGLPHFVGVDWHAMLAHLARVRPAALLGLIVVWLAGLWAYTYVLTASLPGLTHLRAFTLNAAGSAVSNLLPFGGAAGVALTFAMARSWGHPPRAVAASTLVTGAWNMLGRFLLPAVGLLALVVSGRLPDGRLTAAAGIAAVGLVAVVVAGAVTLRWEWAARRVGHAVDVVGRLLPGKLRRRHSQPSVTLQRLRAATGEVVRRAWGRLSVAMAAYLALQAALFVACLKVTGAYPGMGVAVAAFALGRMLTTVVVTPSGFGVSETGTAVLLVHLGAPAAAVAAAVPLFAIFTFVVEIPLGGLTWALWSLFARPRPMKATTGAGMGERVLPR